MGRIALLLSIFAVTAAQIVAAGSCETTEHEFSSGLASNGYGIFLERGDSGLESWYVILPKQFQGYSLDELRLERRIDGHLAFFAYLATRPVGEEVSGVFSVRVEEREQYLAKAVFRKHPSVVIEDACVHVYETTLTP